MMDLDHAKTVVNHLLTATDIKAVYYVDDKFQKDVEIDDHIEKFLIAIEKCYANGQIDDFPEHVRFAGNDNLDAEVRAWWSGMTTEQKQQKLEKYVIGGAENIRPALLVREIMDNQCTCCSPSEWNNNYKAEALDKIGRKESVLLLFDYEFSNKRNGFQYAEDILQTPGAVDCTYCGIISNQFRTEGEFKKRNDYIKQQPGYYIYPLSKDRLIVKMEDYEPFISGLKNILWVKHIESLKKHTEKIFQDAFNKTIDRYHDIQPPAYKQIIVDSSQKEGCREIDTTLRLIQIILDKEIKGAITEDILSRINSEINLISTIHTTDIVHQYPEVDKQAKGFIKDERFLDGNIINTLYTPLQNGDIFKINNTLYILLCQPCNISIRSDGKRGNNDYDTGFLVKLTLTKNIGVSKNHPFFSVWSGVESVFQKDGRPVPDELKSYKKEIQKLFELENSANIPLEFEIGNPGKLYTIRLKDFQTFSLSLLDNVSFNKEGKAIIDFNSTDLPKGLHRNLVTRHKNIIERFKNWTRIKQNVGEQCNNECQKLIDLKELLSKYSQELKFKSIESDKITLQIERIGHYRSPYSDDLLTQFSHYISRTGFPHPFV